MIIKLNPFTTISNKLPKKFLGDNYLFIKKDHKNLSQRWEYQFCKQNNTDINNNSPKNDETNNQTKKQKIIEITKQQFASMKKFLQDIRLSMPIPDISPPSPSTFSKVSQIIQTNQQAKVNNQQITESLTQPYFSSEEHQLSFKLLKLTSPSQFLSQMQQNKQNKNKSIKLMIMHRYCSVGGRVDQFGNQVQKIGYVFMKQLINQMEQLEQTQLVQLLQLYISIYSDINQQKSQQNIKKTLNSLKKIKTIGLPIYQVQKIEKTPPLIKNPSHLNSRLIVLLLHFWTIQFDKQSINLHRDKMNKPIKNGVLQILKYYQLYSQQVHPKINNQRTEANQVYQYPQSSQYSMKDLTYIMTQAYIYQREQDTSFTILLNSIKSATKSFISVDKNIVIDQKLKSNALQIFQTSQYLLQNIQRLSNVSSIKIKENISTLSKQFLKAIDLIAEASLNFKQTQEAEILQQNLVTSLFKTNASSSITSLLYQSLLSLQSYPNSTQSTYLAFNIFTIILKTFSTAKIPILSLLQYSECWQSCMVMHKLIKSQNNKIKQNDIYTLVDSFISKVDLDVWLKLAQNQQDGGKVIEEYIFENQRMLFQCLVGYRMVLLPDLDKNENFKKDINLKLENIVSQSKSRNNLCNLLVTYRKTQESLYKCNLISGPQSSQIHNLIITLMISEAYINSNSQKQIKTFSQYLLTPVICQILREYGVNHDRYGQYVSKILQKYQLM